MTKQSASHRGFWPSRWLFILAAIGSAAGLGNIWRFPFLAYEYGGGAFIIALIIANIVIGVPMLIMEIGLGQMKQKAAPEAFASIHKGFRYLGWFALSMMGIVMAYYMAVMAWSTNYLKDAFTLAWGSDTSIHFFQNTLNLSSGVGELGSLSWSLLIGLILAWVVVYFSIWKGVRSVSKVILWTAGLPIVILILLVIRTSLLPGSLAGIQTLLLPDWGALTNPRLWLAAFSQVFFSLSIAFGVMITYGSFNRDEQEITMSSIWIAAGNFAVSIFSGLAVFATLGYMAHQKEVMIDEVVAAGPGLIFVVLPEALNLMPFARVFAVLFFLTIVLLAIDSAFSIIEAISVGFKDVVKNISGKKISLILSGIFFMLGLPFITGAGLYYLDIIDHFIVNYGIVSVGILQAILVGWVWKGDELRHYINQRSDLRLGPIWKIIIKYVIPLFLIGLLVLNLITELSIAYEGYPIWALLLFGAGSLVLAAVVALVVDSKFRVD